MKKNKNSFTRILKNKQVLTALLMLMVAFAAVANWINTRNEELALEASTNWDDFSITEAAPVSADTSSKIPDYFLQAQLDRQTSRSEALEILREITDNPNTAQAERSKAQEDISKMAFAIENESIIEGLIKAKGFEYSVVYITNSGANVIVKSNGLTPAQITQIKDIVMEKTDFSAPNIKVIEAK